jgi:hypothetical protein
LAKAGLPDGFIEEEYQRLNALAERGEDDPEAPEYRYGDSNPGFRTENRKLS